MDTFDVVVIGFGPSGQVLAAQLGRLGHRVAVFERSPTPYPLPRAGHVDDEIVRIFQSIGAAEAFEERAIPAGDYDWLTAEGELLFRVDWNRATRSTWRSDYIFYQPYLEDALIAASRDLPGVAVHPGWEAFELTEHADHVEVGLREGHRASGRWVPTGRERRVRARYLVGADGANSFVRSTAGFPVTDDGFEHSLSIVDVRLHDLDQQVDMPDAGQICDPARPISLFRWLGREHCRWEFMVLPGEDPDELSSEETSWGLLARWGVHPGNADMIRRTVYTFRSVVADSFGRGRVFLAGDAAHLMPPFLGQGMCSGIRDVTALMWRLDLVLRGISSPDLLESYSTERRPHVQAITRIAVELGRVLCETDPAAAAARDDAFRRGHVPPVAGLPGLTDGALALDTPGAGRLGVQGMVTHRGRSGRFDDVVGRGWVVLCRRADDVARLMRRPLLTDLRATVVHVSRAPVASEDAVLDRDGVYARWFRELGADVLVVRPDLHLFGSAAGSAAAETLLDSLEDALLLATCPAEGETVVDGTTTPRHDGRRTLTRSDACRTIR